MTPQGGARALAESADMRPARRPVAGREQPLFLWLLLQPRDDRLRLLERPGVGLLGERAQLARTGGKVDGGHLERASGRNIAVIASEAKQSREQKSKVDCFVAFAPRNDEKPI